MEKKKGQLNDQLKDSSLYPHFLEPPENYPMPLANSSWGAWVYYAPSLYESIVLTEWLPINSTHNWDPLEAPIEAVNAIDVAQLLAHHGLTIADTYDSAGYTRAWMHELITDKKVGDQSHQIATECINWFSDLPILEGYKDQTYVWSSELWRWVPDLSMDSFAARMAQDIPYDEEVSMSTSVTTSGISTPTIQGQNPSLIAKDKNVKMTKAGEITTPGDGNTKAEDITMGKVIIKDSHPSKWPVTSGTPGATPSP